MSDSRDKSPERRAEKEQRKADALELVSGYHIETQIDFDNKEGIDDYLDNCNVTNYVWCAICYVFMEGSYKDKQHCDECDQWFCDFNDCWTVHKEVREKHELCYYRAKYDHVYKPIRQSL
jgi:hypothetical protein